MKKPVSKAVFKKPPSPKMSLVAKKVSVKKAGSNAGITGGGYQCC